MKSVLLPTLAAGCLDQLRGDRLRALLDAATDVAKGSDNGRLQSLAREILSSAHVRGLLAS